MDPSSNRGGVNCGTNILSDLLNRGKNQSTTPPQPQNGFQNSIEYNSQRYPGPVPTTAVDGRLPYQGWPMIPSNYGPYTCRSYSSRGIVSQDIEMTDNTRMHSQLMKPSDGYQLQSPGHQRPFEHLPSKRNTNNIQMVDGSILASNEMYMSNAVCMYMSLRNNNQSQVSPPISYHQRAALESDSFEVRTASRGENPSPDKTDADSGICTDSEQDEPMDLSCKPRGPSPECSREGYRESSFPPEDEDNNSNSLLRGLLLRSRDKKRSDSIGDSFPNPNAKVRLAKKNLFPVSARVSDWLVKIVQFADSIPEYKLLTQNDRVTLILGSWSRLLLLYMAENNFHFVVSPESVESPRPESPDHPRAQSPSQSTHIPNTVPTMRSVEVLQGLIRKYQSMGLDSQEYELMRISILFHNDAAFLENLDLIERVRRNALGCLERHANAARRDDVMHYSKLLMSLPTLYSIEPKMVEHLFCRHITGNMDVAVFIKEMLKSL
ncbi:uncharacterized protein LOC141909086 isoform X2 [Tubulanus polymorphus]